HDGRPDIDRVARKRTGKVRWSNADDREVVFVERYFLSNDPRVGAEAALPQSVADDGDRMSVGNAILFRDEGAPDHGLHAEDIEVVSRNDGASHALRLLAAAQIERQNLVREQSGQSNVAVPEVDVVEIGRG